MPGTQVGDTGGEGGAGGGTVVVMAGGDAPAPAALAGLRAGTVCVAADSGYDHAVALGLDVVALVGDLDSVSPAGLARAEVAAATGALEIERHPADKDRTDLELALARALARHPARIVVAGIGGGRLDHLLGNLAVLADPRWAGAGAATGAGGRGGVEIDGVIDGAWIRVVHHRRTLVGEVGDVVSLVAVNGDAEGVTTAGLHWPLRGETLRAGSGRGVSNLFAEREATVELTRGVLFAVQPGGDGT